jgi:curved DNA-binding protein CbpA
MKSLYDILGIAKDATPDVIKAAFRKKAQSSHPDKENGNEDEFKEVNKAYAILSNDVRRIQYDQTGSTEAQQDPREFARQTIANTILAMVDSKDVEHHDLVDLVRQNIQAYISGMNIQKRQVEAGIKKLNSAIVRITAPDGIVQDIMKGRSDELDRQLKHMQSEIDRHQEVLLVLKDYKYKVDPVDHHYDIQQQLINQIVGNQTGQRTWGYCR